MNVKPGRRVNKKKRLASKKNNKLDSKKTAAGESKTKKAVLKRIRIW